MNATTITPGTAIHPYEDVELSRESAQKATCPSRRGPERNALAGKIYRFHGFRLLDADGQAVGLVDWIWTDEASGQGEFIGVHLRWLRGKARAVPAHDLHIDRQGSTIQVAYTREQIKHAPRYAIDRELTVENKRSIYSYYRPSPAAVPCPVVAEGLAA